MLSQVDFFKLAPNIVVIFPGLITRVFLNYLKIIFKAILLNHSVKAVHDA